MSSDVPNFDDILQKLKDLIATKHEDKPLPCSVSTCEATQPVKKCYVNKAYFAFRNSKLQTLVDEKLKKETNETINAFKKRIEKRKSELTIANPNKNVQIINQKDGSVRLFVRNHKPTLSVNKISSAVAGFKCNEKGSLCVVVESSGLNKRKVTVEILGSKNETFISQNQNVAVLHKNVEVTNLEGIVGKFDKDYDNEDDYRNYLIIDFELRPKADDDLKKWKERISSVQDKTAYFHLKVTANEPNGELWYNNVEDSDNGTLSLNQSKGIYLNKESLFFKVTSCYCNVEFQLQDLVTFGVNEALASKHLNGLNSILNESEFSINTCIRKMYFLSQVFPETGYLQKLTERTIHSNPFDDGRGLIQLTTENNYVNYFKYELAKGNIVYSNEFYSEEYERLSNIKNEDKRKIKAKENSLKRFLKDETLIKSVANAPKCYRSAGWFWQNFGLNGYADLNDIIYASFIVNGGFNGFDHRKENVDKFDKLIYKFCNETRIEQKTFSDSLAYQERKTCFAWAIWHDPNLKPSYDQLAALGQNKSVYPCNSDSSKAREGYERFNSLSGDDFKNKYLINKLDTESDDDVYASAFVEESLRNL